ncbi:hypothetical protein EG329_011822 [Mollisiaceae sp. DMI_Dod_QoI]|nr:hypothetical protein EG329_011822 [Helotiales sp. DMI_Dod_QoI]
MLPHSLWILILSFSAGMRADFSPHLRISNYSNSVSPSSSLSSSLSSTHTAGATSGTSSRIARTYLTTSSTPGAALTSRSSRPSIRSSKTVGNDTLPTDPTLVCCFVIQDTVSEDWWQQTSYLSTTSLVNLTSYTTYITHLPNITTTRIETNVYPTNASFSFTLTVGRNPISNLLNQAPTPTQITHILTDTAIMTGGVYMQSPAAFYVYHTVKIITADPVTDGRGNVNCATMSTGAHGDVFPRINENAQAYFGSLNISGESGNQTETTTTKSSDGDDITSSTSYESTAAHQASNPSGVVISLVTPFIYAPPRGTMTPNADANCSQDSDTEAYGYIPATLIDFLVQDPRYSAQYPGIESCYGGGPSIIQVTHCNKPFESTVYQTVGGDLTSSTTIYVGVPSIHQDSTSAPGPPATEINGGASKVTPTLPTGDTTPLTVPPTRETPSTSFYTVPPPTTTLPDLSYQNPLGAIIASLVGGVASSSSAAPTTILATTTIPLSLAPAGAIGLSSNIDGIPVLILAPTTITPQPAIIIPASTTIPLFISPPGAVGTVETINGTPVLILAPTTIPPQLTTLAPVLGAGEGLQTTTISGIPYLIIPGPGQTTIPLSLLSSLNIDLNLATDSGFTMTTINGTPCIVIPGPMTMLELKPTLTASIGDSGSGSGLGLSRSTSTSMDQSPISSPSLGLSPSLIPSQTNKGLVASTSTSRAGTVPTSGYGRGKSGLLGVVGRVAIGALVAF